MANNHPIPYFLLTLIFLTLSIPTTHQIALPTPTISAAPAVLPDPPLPPYSSDLSPDIAPLLPSPGGASGSRTGSSMPTIPSTRSPNPDMLDPVGPDSAVAPSSGLLQESAAPIKGGFFSCCFVFWVLVVFII